MRQPTVLVTLLCLYAVFDGRAMPLSGTVVTGMTSNAVAGARVTLFTPNLQLFREQRSGSDGSFRFDYVGEGDYRLGVAALGFEYQERSVSVSNMAVTQNFVLAAETNDGRWTIVGNTAPELLDGTGSGSLLPTGEVLFCHDTEDPVVFDPVAALNGFLRLPALAKAVTFQR